MPDPQRRIPGGGAIIAIAFLIVPLVAVGWWLNRPRPGPAENTALADLDVVCQGRIDGERPIASLDPAGAGKVAAVFVQEGQAVKAKEKLLKLDDEALQLRVDEAREAVAFAEIDVEAAQVEQKVHPRRKLLQEGAVATAENRAAAARSLYIERKAGREFGSVSAAELIAAESETKQLEHLVEAEKARLEELTATDAALRTRMTEAKKAMAQTSLKQAEKAVRDCLLLAPSDGVILRIQTSVGEAVAPGGPQPAIIFRPDGPLIVRAELEQEFLGRVKPGMKAIIRDDVRSDSPTWTGSVQRIGGWVARKRSILLDPGEVNDVRTVECLIALDGKPEGLLIGQRMRVRIGKD
jgi:multidrug resistance efflux pump